MEILKKKVKKICKEIIRLAPWKIFERLDRRSFGTRGETADIGLVEQCTIFKLSRNMDSFVLWLKESYD